MDALLDHCILFWLLFDVVITSCILFCFIRRIEACSTDVEEDLKKPVTNVVSENAQTQRSEKVLYLKFDRHEEKEQKSRPNVLLVPAVFMKPTSGLDEEVTLELKYRCNEKGVVVYRPKWQKTVNAPYLGMNVVESHP
ncbi:Bacitracin synthase [Trichinella pseudospiralis]